MTEMFESVTHAIMIGLYIIYILIIIAILFFFVHRLTFLSFSLRRAPLQSVSSLTCRVGFYGIAAAAAMPKIWLTVPSQFAVSFPTIERLQCKNETAAMLMHCSPGSSPLEKNVIVW